MRVRGGEDGEKGGGWWEGMGKGDREGIWGWRRWDGEGGRRGKTHVVEIELHFIANVCEDGGGDVLGAVFADGDGDCF